MHVFVFFFNDTAPTEIYTLSLHDALPIYAHRRGGPHPPPRPVHCRQAPCPQLAGRSEEHTSELQSLTNLVCRLLLEKKKEDTQIVSNPTSNRALRALRLYEIINDTTLSTC